MRRTSWTDEELAMRARLEAGDTVVVNMSKSGQPRLWAWAKSQGLAQRIDRFAQWGNPTKSTKAARDKRQHADELKKELEAAEQRHIVYDQARNRARTKVYEAVQAEPTSEHAATLTALAADELAEAERLTQQRDAAAARSRDYAKAAAGMHHFPRALPADGTPFWADLDAERAWAGDKAALQLMVDYIANLERGPVGPPTKGRENEFDTRRVNPYLNYYG